MGITPSFWRGRRVLVTGHTGFKGSWMSEWLIGMGAEVCGLALAPTTQPSIFESLALADRMQHHLADVRDAKTVEKLIRNFAPQTLFHMAAQPLVRASYAAPLETYATNVMGTAHVLEACRDLPDLEAVIVITTDKCYENLETHRAYVESDPMGGHDPYSSSKACAELVAASYRRSFFSEGQSPRIATVRAGNVIGGGDWSADRLIPDAVRAFSENRALNIRYPEAVRPWQHVLEPLHGYLSLAEALSGDHAEEFAEAFNFGPEERDAQSVRRIADHLVRLWPESPGWVTDGEKQPHEASLLRLDISKAESKLGWHPVLHLEEALEWTIAWYRAVSVGDNACDITQQQISNYINKIQEKYQ